MTSLFGIRVSGRQQQPESPAGSAEALVAGWVSPPPEARIRIEAAAGASDERSDATAFLARVYLHQQC